MNKINWKFLKFVTLILVIFVSGLALYIHQESADFDPIKEIQRLKAENRRDDALDMVKFFKENKQANPDEIKSLEMDLEYSTAEKIKSLVWDGLFKGQVYDTYSGLRQPPHLSASSIGDYPFQPLTNERLKELSGIIKEIKPNVDKQRLRKEYSLPVRTISKVIRSASYKTCNHSQIDNS